MSLCKPKRAKEDPTRYPTLFHSTPDGPIFLAKRMKDGERNDDPKKPSLYSSFKKDGLHVAAVEDMAKPVNRTFRAHKCPPFARYVFQQSIT